MTSMKKTRRYQTLFVGAVSLCHLEGRGLWSPGKAQKDR